MTEAPPCVDVNLFVYNGAEAIAAAIVHQIYPPEHNLHAIGPDRLERAPHLMRRYASLSRRLGSRHARRTRPNPPRA